MFYRLTEVDTTELEQHFLSLLNLPDPVKKMTSQIAIPLPFDFSTPGSFGNTKSSTSIQGWLFVLYNNIYI